MRRLLLFVFLSLTVCGLVNPGNFGIIDTTRRLQAERWLRLGEPPVSPADHDFGIIGRNGVRHVSYGIGQSLLLAPFDALVSATVLPLLPRLGLDHTRQQQIIELLIAFLMQSFLAVCTLVLAYRILLSFEFPPFASMAGALGLLFGSMYLQYTQSAAENNLLLVLSLCALYAIRRYHASGEIRWAALAGAACGYAILVRLPSVMETGVLLMFALSVRCDRKRFLAGYLPPVALAVLFDRWYHWLRFGELFSTYLGILARQYRHTSARTDFPFSYPFWKGFLGTFFSPDKSILLFDPLLVVMLLVAIWKWRSMTRALRLVLGWLLVLLLSYICFYARYYDFGGDVAWGHRFVTLPVQLLALFAVPLLLASASVLPGFIRRTAWALVGLAVAVQAASTTLAANLEIIQREHGYDYGVLTNRIINLVQIATSHEDPARFAGVSIEWRTLYYFPFQLRFRFPQLADWAIGLWVVLLICLLFLVAAALRSERPARSS